MNATDPASAAARGLALLGGGREDEAVELLTTAVDRWPDDAACWQGLALSHRAAEQLAPAVAAMARAAALAPADARIQQGLAQCRYEAGLRSRPDFERALALAPGDDAVAQGLVAAVAAEDGPGAALALAKGRLSDRPDWLAGYWLVSRLTATAGLDGAPDAAIAAAVGHRPADLALWQQWLAVAMQSKSWPRALDVVRSARQRFPGDTALAWNEAGILSELGETAAADALFRSFGPLPDLASAIFICRHWLRTGQPEQVLQLHSMLDGPAGAEALYPYFGLAWRLLGDPRATWLEPPELVGVYDLGEQLPPLEELAAFLRGLHRQVRQPLEQSVRGGTQTDAHLLLRADPIVQQLRQALVGAVERHRAQLPAIDPAHPQLRHARHRPIRFAGSWSVRLAGGGFHEEHVHPEGWFSSALYVALPESLGQDGQAGWLTLGQPQQSLGLALGPTRVIEPRPGRLVLFPSTMWHGTVPFTSGERLTVAFDVAVPRG
ncbi:putative 2OG-Fe(II) oxygenase [Sphingomonas sp. KRR8]|uniref:putative 2OG-Fe(II) oxygenase n=1 Tax=Sphingomonas sp. KRR8 TaxID=2942996 RepID=UPI0020207635|nr:putative 2OG-Fe(II) oxygenase [Sphingomonas sp. KRR8]URD60007.1 putative 2OG-Fe(II) oxygenase [Sphingomonas sp. KRR8]